MTAELPSHVLFSWIEGVANLLHKFVQGGPRFRMFFHILGERLKADDDFALPFHVRVSGLSEKGVRASY